MKKTKRKVLMTILIVFLSLPVSVSGASQVIVSGKSFSWSGNSGTQSQIEINYDENVINSLVSFPDQAGQQTLFAPPPGGGSATGEYAPVSGSEFGFFSCVVVLYLVAFYLLRKKKPVAYESDYN